LWACTIPEKDKKLVHPVNEYRETVQL